MAFDLTGLGALAGSIGPGYDAAQQRHNVLADQAARLQQQQDTDYAQKGLGEFLANLQMGQPTPIGAGQPSVPNQPAPQADLQGGALTTSTGQPGLPPGAPTPGGAPAPAPAQPSAQAAPAAAAKPPAQPAAASAAPTAQPPTGLTSPQRPTVPPPAAAQQDDFRTLAKTLYQSNPQYWSKNPRALLLATQQMVQMRQVDAKEQLAAAQLQSKLDQFAQTLQFKQLSEADRRQARQEADNLRMQIAQLTDSRQRDLAQNKLDSALTLLAANLAGKKDLQTQKDTAAGDRQKEKEAADREKNTVSPDDPRVKAIANYQIPPGGAFGSNTPYGTALMNAVLKVNPNYQASQYQAKNAAVTKFTSGKQGDTIRSFNVATSHLDTLGELTDALKNGDTQAINKIGNTVSGWTGGTAPTNFDAARTIVGQEITKAIVASGGGQKEREEAAAKLSLAKTPAQLKGVIDTYKKLLVGQLNGYRRQYEQATGLKNFDDFLSPETRSEGGSASPAPTGDGVDTNNPLLKN